MCKRILCVLLICVVAMLSACVSHYRAYEGPERLDSEVAYINTSTRTNDGNTHIWAVDGKREMVKGFGEDIAVLPGTHTFQVKYYKTLGGGGSLDGGLIPVTINAKAGRRYAIFPEVYKNGDKKTWKPIVKDITGQGGQ